LFSGALLELKPVGIMPRRFFMSKKFYKRLLKKANASPLLVVAGGVLLGAAAVAIVFRNLKLKGRRVVNSLDREFKSVAQSQVNKPYPIEHTSKRHPRSRLQMRDAQKLSH